MKKHSSMIDETGEVRELTAKDMKQFRPAREVLPASLRKKVGVRGPQKAPVKQAVSVRYSPEVLEQFRASGAGWQARMDAALKDWLKTHDPRDAV